MGHVQRMTPAANGRGAEDGVKTEGGSDEDANQLA
jgi:hypothetical protein